MGWYRKKPVVVEAEQWTPGIPHPQVVLKPCEPPFCPDVIEVPGRPGLWHAFIHTLEGEMSIRPGNWIIKGVRGEFYPCRADIFAETYETVEEPG